MSESKNSRMLRVRLGTIERLDALSQRWWEAEGNGQMSKDWESDYITYSEMIDRLIRHYEAYRARRKRAARARREAKRAALLDAAFVPSCHVAAPDGSYYRNPLCNHTNESKGAGNE